MLEKVALIAGVAGQNDAIFTRITHLHRDFRHLLNRFTYKIQHFIPACEGSDS
jgi:hypothetical protein